MVGFYSSNVRYKSTQISNAAFKTLRATPIEVVPAPADSNKLIEVVGGLIIFDYTAAYTESADNLALKYTDGSGAAAAQVVEATGFVDATADTIINIYPNVINTLYEAAEIGEAVVLHNNGDGEFGGGDAANVITVKVFYRVHILEL